VFTNMELWTEIRRRVLAGELSKLAACREYDLHWDTLNKILEHVEPPGYRRSKPNASLRSNAVAPLRKLLASSATVISGQFGSFAEGQQSVRRWVPEFQSQTLNYV
jgi:hypothetical protein